MSKQTKMGVDSWNDMEKRNSRPTGLRRELRECIIATVTTTQTELLKCAPRLTDFFIVLETGARNPPEVKIVFATCQDITCHSSANVICFHVESLNIRV